MALLCDLASPPCFSSIKAGWFTLCFGITLSRMDCVSWPLMRCLYSGKREAIHSLEITAKTMAIASITGVMSSIKKATSDTEWSHQILEALSFPADHQLLHIGLLYVTKSHTYTQRVQK